MTRAILLMGPTASGKTELALHLAEKYSLEIISVDSALIYRGMDIGTAKPTSAEQELTPHHLIDILTPMQTYSVADFIRDSVQLIRDINARGKVALLVGGTMMYYNGLMHGLSQLPPADSAVREKLEQRGLELGWNQLHTELLQIDPVAAGRIKPNDKQRLIRALEVFYLSGKPITLLQQEQKNQPAEDITFLPLAILPARREVLHQRILHRFDKMLDTGFIAEVEQLKLTYPELTATHTSMRSVGYSQVWQYLSGELTCPELREAGIVATRQLAKRQITWLRSMEIINLDAENDLNSAKLFNRLLFETEKFLATNNA